MKLIFNHFIGTFVRVVQFYFFAYANVLHVLADRCWEFHNLADWSNVKVKNGCSFCLIDFLCISHICIYRRAMTNPQIIQTCRMLLYQETGHYIFFILLFVVTESRNQIKSDIEEISSHDIIISSTRR